MKKYIFTDTDYEGRGEEEYDITGEDYKELIRTCAKYCDSFAFVLKNVEALPKELDSFKLPITTDIIEQYGYDNAFVPQVQKLFVQNEPIYHYKVCTEMIEWFLWINDSLYDWYYVPEKICPEDLTFYRKDGSVFFSSVTHEGYCELTVRDDEDVSHIISKDHWLYREPGMMWYKEL